ncbi:MAG: SDR family oxidoreductase [Bacteroidales bacterium]|nr:SDR family oxidoreductase [Bacteroidales bacterium]
MKKTVFITGATAGIGEAAAILLAKNGYRLILSGRRSQRLQQLESDLKSKFKAEVFSLTFDVRNREEVAEAIDSLPKEWKVIDILINNAGLAAGLDLMHEGSLDDWDIMVDTNIKGLLYMTRAIAPQMVERKSGHIVNIGSIAGREVYEKGNVYCASKHFVNGITKGMRIDMLKYNIKVTNIEPGIAETEFANVRFKGDKKRADQVYVGWTPLYAEDIAEAILFAITRPPHVNINDMLIMATDQANVNHINKRTT